jgi:hypothetical protein
VAAAPIFEKALGGVAEGGDDGFGRSGHGVVLAGKNPKSEARNSKI